MKNKKEYLIGVLIYIETYCLLLLGMNTSCFILDIAILRWIAYIKFMNPEFKHILKKK